MHKTIGILAHVDAGKTTFSEQLLFETEAIREKGRVDHQSAFLDTHAIERERGITIFSDQATFSYGDSTYTMIDTPGHVDFSPEMERTIRVMDYAIVIVSAVEGVEGHTETVWQLLRKYKIPTFFFLNKIDREGADVTHTMAEIRTNLTEDACFLANAPSSDGLSEEVIEFVAERDETLFAQVIEGDYEEQLWLSKMKELIAQQDLFICMAGAALKGLGIGPFIEVIDQLTATAYDEEGPFSATVYKIRHEESGKRITFLKVLSGQLAVREEVGNSPTKEKVNELRVYNGKKYSLLPQVKAGMLVGVTGLSQLAIGDSIGLAEEHPSFELIPTLTATVLHDASIHAMEVFNYFQQLDAEDPSLRVFWDEHFQEVHVHVMGAIQLEVLKGVLQERFDLEVTFGPPSILYKETIATPVTGYGHFEPLRHYAEVHLKMEAGPRGSGLVFENRCHANDLSTGHQALIRQHLFEREHHGLLTGSPLTDIKVTLLTGRAHEEHTAGGDFREATFRALRQGLEQAENILLEPMYAFKIKVHVDHIGRILADIQQAHGSFDAPETLDDHVLVTGRVPVATFMTYERTFLSVTNGKGILRLTFSGYEPCHNAAEVIERIGYDKNADPAYSSSSIFCAKGKGYVVPWDQAKEAMHCL